MKKISGFLISSLLLASSVATSVEAKSYYLKFNEKDSKINFFVSSTLHEVHGEVRKFKGFISVNADDENVNKADGLLEITTDSLFTNQSQRDSRLKSETMTVATYPLIKFKVNRAKVTAKPNKEGIVYMKLGGNLTIRDVTKNVEIPVKVKLSPDKNTASVVGSYVVNFKEYNVPDPSIPIIGKVDPNINITFDIKTY